MSERMRKKYIHHERRPVKILGYIPEDGGYTLIRHVNCNKTEDNKSNMNLVFMYLDGQWCDRRYTGGPRVVLVYECIKCKKQQVLKMILENDKIEIEEKLINLKYINYKKMVMKYG